jgi:hypothetical protein
MNASGYPLDSAYPNGLCATPQGFGAFDHRVVGDGWGVGCLLHETEEELSPALGSAAVEAKRKFVEVVGQVFV